MHSEEKPFLWEIYKMSLYHKIGENLTSFPKQTFSNTFYLNPVLWWNILFLNLRKHRHIEG